MSLRLFQSQVIEHILYVYIKILQNMMQLLVVLDDIVCSRCLVLLYVIGE